MVQLETLKKIPVFKRLPKKHLEQLGKISEIKNFEKNEIIFFEKSTAWMLFIVIRGSIKVYKSADREHVKTLSYLSDGDIFGEMAIFSSGGRSATAEAMTPCNILLIKAEPFKKFATKNVPILVRIITMLSERLKKADEENQSLAYNSVLARVVLVLLDFARQYGVRKGGKTLIDFQLTQVEIANLVGSARVVVTRMLGKLESLKCIEYEKGRIAILSFKNLRKIIY